MENNKENSSNQNYEVNKEIDLIDLLTLIEWIGMLNICH